MWGRDGFVALRKILDVPHRLWDTLWLTRCGECGDGNLTKGVAMKSKSWIGVVFGMAAIFGAFGLGVWVGRTSCSGLPRAEIVTGPAKSYPVRWTEYAGISEGLTAKQGYAAYRALPVYFDMEMKRGEEGIKKPKTLGEIIDFYRAGYVGHCQSHNNSLNHILAMSDYYRATMAAKPAQNTFLEKFAFEDKPLTILPPEVYVDIGLGDTSRYDEAMAAKRAGKPLASLLPKSAVKILDPHSFLFAPSPGHEDRFGIEILGWGDYNHDGIEDIACLLSDLIYSGTIRSTRLIFFTRRTRGGMLERLDTPAAVAPFPVRWTEHAGIAPGQTPAEAHEAWQKRSCGIEMDNGKTATTVGQLAKMRSQGHEPRYTHGHHGSSWLLSRLCWLNWLADAQPTTVSHVRNVKCGADFLTLLPPSVVNLGVTCDEEVEKYNAADKRGETLAEFWAGVRLEVLTPHSCKIVLDKVDQVEQYLDVYLLGWADCNDDGVEDVLFAVELHGMGWGNFAARTRAVLALTRSNPNGRLALVELR